MVFVRILSTLAKDKTIGHRIVPIVPDEARTFGMEGMFKQATSFNGDISRWDVSSVNNMRQMFRATLPFRRDISEWEVSSVINMDCMFQHARAFSQKLCGVYWVRSKARKIGIFEDSSGSISNTVCAPSTRVFSPRRRSELKGAVDEYLKLSPKGDGFYGCLLYTSPSPRDQRG